MTVDKFLQGVLLKRINEHREEVGNEFTEGHSMSSACAETELQSPVLIEKVDQAQVMRLLKSPLFEDSSGDILLILIVSAHKIPTFLKLAVLVKECKRLVRTVECYT